MAVITLSESAVALLRGYRGDIVTGDANREACRELAVAGFLVAGHTFTGGREVFYRMTQAGVELAAEHGWMQVTATSPPPSISASPLR